MSVDATFLEALKADVDSMTNADLIARQEATLAALQEQTTKHDNLLLDIGVVLACDKCSGLLKNPRTVACCGATFCDVCLLRYRKVTLGLVDKLADNPEDDVYAPEPVFGIEIYDNPPFVRCPACAKWIYGRPHVSKRLAPFLVEYRKLRGLEQPREIEFTWPEADPLVKDRANVRFKDWGIDMAATRRERDYTLLEDTDEMDRIRANAKKALEDKQALQVKNQGKI